MINNNTKMCKKKQFKYCPSEIDECMRNFIKNLNYFNIKTLASCCGHGKYPMTIIVESGYGNFELVSGSIIPRKRNFYKKDKQGYYYIPEVSAELSGNTEREVKK